MTFGPRLARLTLTTHVATSVGWLGAAALSIVLGVTGLVSQQPAVVRGVYLSLRPVGWYGLLPFGLAALATGLVQSLGSRWGLMRHYWVVFKLVITVVAVGVLLLYLQTLNQLADMALQATATDNVGQLRSPSAVVHASAAVVLLVTATVLSIYKPRGLTRYGRRHRAGPPAVT